MCSYAKLRPDIWYLRLLMRKFPLRMCSHFLSAPEDFRKPWRTYQRAELFRGSLAVWGNSSHLLLTTSTRRSASLFSWRETKTKQRMKLFLLLVISCLALHNSKGKSTVLLWSDSCDGGTADFMWALFGQVVVETSPHVESQRNQRSEWSKLWSEGRQGFFFYHWQATLGAVAQWDWLCLSAKWGYRKWMWPQSMDVTHIVSTSVSLLSWHTQHKRWEKYSDPLLQ